MYSSSTAEFKTVVVVPGGALFIWATVMPDSWYDWGGNGVWLAPACVAGASISFGGLAVLLRT